MKIVLANRHLGELCGSEINILEFSEYLVSKGHSVSVVTKKLGSPLDSLLCKVVNVYSPSTLPKTNYDLILIQHHNELLTDLIQNGFFAKRAILYVLSVHPQVGFELPAKFRDFYSKIFVNSWETKTKWESLIPNLKTDVFPNMAPEEFFTAAKEATKLKTVAIVSSHVPQDLTNSIPMLNKLGIDVKRYGYWGGKVTRITPDVLGESDVVITIGKTVQYCLAQKIPIYCYDRFGGDGYINMENIEHAGKYNFAGRCCNRKITPEQIANEIVTGYDKAVESLDAVRDYARKNFSLSGNFGNLIDNIECLPLADWPLLNLWN